MSRRITLAYNKIVLPSPPNDVKYPPLRFLNSGTGELIVTLWCLVEFRTGMSSMFGGSGNTKSFGTDGSGDDGASFGNFGGKKIGIGLLGGGFISCTGLIFAFGATKK